MISVRRQRFISKHHMLLPNGRCRRSHSSYNYFKTSYVITKLVFAGTTNMAINDFKTSYVITKQVQPTGVLAVMLFQNIICYYQTRNYFTNYILNHAFQNIICYYQTHGFKPSFNPLIPWKPLNHGIFFKFYQPTPNFRNDS